MRLVLATIVCLMMLVSASSAGDDSDVSVSLLNIKEARFRAHQEDAKNQFAENKLTITLVLTGAAAKTATHWGHVGLSDARDDTGASLALQAGYNNVAESWVQINREHMWFFNENPPEDAIKVELELDPSARGSALLETFAGSIKLKASDVAEVLISDVAGVLGKAIEDDALSQAGVGAVVESFAPENPNEWVKLKVTGPEEAIQAIEVVDPAGKRLDNGRMWFKMGDTTTYTLSGEGELAGDARLKIAVETSNDVTEVPFSFKDVTLP